NNQSPITPMPTPIPPTNLTWPYFGAGIGGLGVGGQPVVEPMPVCGPEEILVRVDALGLCASDAKMVRMGPGYPLFFPRDFAANPARLGHEAALTVIEVGERWRQHYRPGQRLGVQANVYNGGQRAIFGVNIPGAMAQYLLLDERVLAGDEGAYVFPVSDDALSYADIALLEPWACVDVAYTPVRRLEPKPGGDLWIRGRPGDDTPYHFSASLSSVRIFLADCPPSLLGSLRTQPLDLIDLPTPHPLLPTSYSLLPTSYSLLPTSYSLLPTPAFDDIILLDPIHASAVAEAADHLAHGGVLNLVSPHPLDGLVAVDVGRLHYEPLAFVGCPGPDISQAYGPARNHSELRTGGVTLIVGAGGALGRMHVQRALEMPEGPRAVIATNRGRVRLDSLIADFGPLARARGRELVGISPATEPDRLEAEIDRLTGGRGCDDVVVVAPNVEAMAQAADYLAADGMLVLFAGVPVGTKIPLPLDRVALHGAQFTGTSGSSVADELRVLAKVRAGQLSPARSVVAIGGMRAMAAGIQAVIDQAYPGKIIIYPQLPDLPLLSLHELRNALPKVYDCLGPNETWTREAELLVSRDWLLD
ncbi:MAG: zinc-binding dehydrogenase, partial [Caldilineales bacterium]|nr:zinc-binding dehydrogenase [Caldilineales bacterium]